MALADRSRRPVRYANQLPAQVEMLIIACKREKPHWGARKIREVLVRRLAGDVRIPASTPTHEASHMLPNRHFWEAWQFLIVCKPLETLVSALGLEPRKSWGGW